MGADLYGLHPHGVAACSAIDKLHLVRCRITGDRPERYFDFTKHNDSAPDMPTGMSALTLLLSLALTIAGSAFREPAVVDLKGLASLPLYQDLFVRSEAYHVGLSLSADSSALQKLTSLHFDAPRWGSRQFDGESYDPFLCLDVEWSSEHALQCVTLCNWHFTCTSNIVQLTALRSLSTVTFNDSVPLRLIGGGSSFNCFGLMVYRLGRCPHVKLSIDEEMTV